MKKFCEGFNVKLHYTPLYFPAANMTERYNRTVKQALAIFAKDDHRTWDEHLSYVVFALRTATSEVTGFTPAKLVFGRELDTPLNADSSLLTGQSSPFDPSQHVQNVDEERRLIYKKAIEAYNKAKTKQQQRYNLRHRPVHLKVGDLVYHKNFSLSNAGERTTAKLNPKYVGPFKISQIVGNCHYQLVDLKDAKDHGRWHVSHLKLLTADTNVDDDQDDPDPADNAQPPPSSSVTLSTPPSSP
jgi:hypothetical protein